MPLDSLITPSLQETWFDRKQHPLQGHLLVEVREAIHLSGIKLELEKVFPGKGKEQIGLHDLETRTDLTTDTPQAFPFSIDYNMPTEQVFDLFGMSGTLKATSESLGSTLGHIASDFYLQLTCSGTCKREPFSETHRLLIRIL